MKHDRPITLLLCALGGEGGGVLTEWLVEIARHAGYAAQATSIPGVAQRTGATTYYLEVFPVPVAQLQGCEPVLSLNPLPGTLDAIVSSELLETARQISNGLANAARTTVITSHARAFTTAERMELGDGRVDAPKLMTLVRAQSIAQHVLEMGVLAKQSGTAISAVMLGAVAASGVLPFARADYEQVVAASGASAAASLRGFAAAFEVVQAQRAQAQNVAPSVAQYVTQVLEALPDEAPVIAQQALQALPVAVQAMAQLGYARTLEYQDRAYAERYFARLKTVVAADTSADFAASVEAARWLALWMAFDDIVRVADLKSRASRASRVRGEVKAGADDIVKTFEHFKPGIAEFAALLPAGWAGRLQRWDRARVATGKPPWALPLKVGSHSVAGMLALRTLASLKWLRVRGARFADEQRQIDAWKAALVAGLQASPELGLALARCGRLIKGYGVTNERGKENLLHITDQLATADQPAERRAAAIEAALAAALKDEGGVALDQALQAHGAAARPVKAQPIRWMKKPVAPVVSSL